MIAEPNVLRVAREGYATGRVLDKYGRNQVVLMKQSLLCSGTQDTVCIRLGSEVQVVQLITCVCMCSKVIDKQTGTLSDLGTFF